MIKILAPALFVNILFGCTTIADRVEIVHTPINCQPYLYPQPLSLFPLQGFTNKGTHWEFTHDDWSKLVAWQLEVDRYLRAIRIMQTAIEECITTYNAQYTKPVE